MSLLAGLTVRVKALGRRIGEKVKEKVREYRESRDLGVMTYTHVDGVPDPVVRERISKKLKGIKKRAGVIASGVGGRVGREKVIIQRTGSIYAVTYTAEIIAGKEMPLSAAMQAVKNMIRHGKMGKWEIDVKAGKKLRLLLRYVFTVRAIKHHAHRESASSRIKISKKKNTVKKRRRKKRKHVRSEPSRHTLLMTDLNTTSMYS